MSSLATCIAHVEYIKQLTRHLHSIPATRTESKKRGGIAIVIRVVPQNKDHMQTNNQFPLFSSSTLDHRKPDASTLVQAVESFLRHPGLQDARAQILFIQRARYAGDPWSGHIGFPGGKQDPEDNGNDRVTAEREMREELGIDLNNTLDFVHLGRLDDTRVQTMFGNVIMTVSPQVYLQVTENTPTMVISDEVASAHWVDLDQILCRVDHPVQPFSETYKYIPVDIATRICGTQSFDKPPSLVYRITSRFFGRLCYTVLPLGFTPENTVFGGNKAKEETHSERYAGVKFASDTELYLWGLSLVMLCSLVDLALPFNPTEGIPNYISVASPWPQMESMLWTDYNFMVNIAHRLLWNPRKRKPWCLSNLYTECNGNHVVGQHAEYFDTYFFVAKAAFAVSCVCKTAAIYVVGRAATVGVRVAAQSIMSWFVSAA